MFAISFDKTPSGFELKQVEDIFYKDITPNDERIMTTRECDVDWIVEALLTHLNKEATR